jgi:hypothetical protein
MNNLFQAVKENPALLMPEGDKKQNMRLAGIDDGSSGKDDRKEQRKKKAAGKTSTQRWHPPWL